MRNLLNKLFGAKKQNNAVIDTNVALMNMIAEQNKVIADLSAKVYGNTTVANEVCVTNTNTSIKPNHIADEEANTYESNVNRNNFEVRRGFSKDFENVDWKELQRTNYEAITLMIDELKENIMTSLNPNFYREVMEGYRAELLQQYYMFKLIQRGQYSPESDNLDSLSKEQIISALCELEIEEWVERQIRKGKNPCASTGQIDLLKKNNVDTTDIKYWFQASKAIESVLGAYDNKATTSQKEKIATLVSELGLQGYDMSVTTKKDASVKIGELLTLHEEKFGAKMPSKDQKITYARYLQLNNMKLTKGRKEAMDSMTARELSEAINELKVKYNTEHPEASEGQVNYIVSLCDQLMVGYDINSIRELDKASATRKIDELTRQLLYRKMRRTNVTVTMDMVNALSKDEVKIKLDEFRTTK